MHSLRVLETRHLKSVSLGQNQGVSRATLLPEALGENPQVSIPWLVATSFQSSRPASLNLSFLHLHITFSFVCGQISLCLPLIRTHVIIVRARSGNSKSSPQLKIFYLIITAKILFPNNLKFTGSRDYGVISLEAIIQPTSHISSQPCS